MTLQQIHNQFYPTFQSIYDSELDGRSAFVSSSKPSTNTIEFDYLLQVSSLFSSKIEGNTLDLNSYFNQSQVAIKSRSKEFTEVFDLASSYQFAKASPITKFNFLKTHKIATSSFLESFQIGKYRQSPVGVFGSSGIVYMAVEAENVESEMKLLFGEIKKLLSKKLNYSQTIFFAGLIHLKIAQIHPFVDGNGKNGKIIRKVVFG